MRSKRSKKAVVYAIQALRLYRDAKDLLTSDQVARQLDIAPDYADKVNRMLREAGLIKSERGAMGGYRLVVGLKHVSIAKMIRGLDKSINRILDDDAGDTEDMLAIRKRLRDTLVSGGWGESVCALL